MLAKSLSCRSLICVFLLATPFTAQAAELKPESTQAWNTYVAAKQARLDQCPRLAMAGSPQAECLREGTIIVHPTNQNGTLPVPSALIHDWTGLVFIPHASLPDVLNRLRSYEEYPRFFPLTVTSATTLSSEGACDRFSVTMRHEVLTIRTGLTGEYVSEYHQLDPAHAFSLSTAIRLQEITNPASSHPRTLDPGQGSGFNLAPLLPNSL